MKKKTKYKYIHRNSSPTNTGMNFGKLRKFLIAPRWYLDLFYIFFFFSNKSFFFFVDVSNFLQVVRTSMQVNFHAVQVDAANTTL